MEKEQLKLYKSTNWHEFRDRIIERDNHCCCRCGKSDKEVQLQVHHLNYICGRKPWQYPEIELETLCKGCHAEEHGHIMPKAGWDYVEENDLGDLSGVCEFCGSELRYEHTLYHPKWGYLTVGTQCADNLTDEPVASKSEENRRKTASELRRYLDSPKWKRSGNSYIRNFKGFNIIIKGVDYNKYQISLLKPGWNEPLYGNGIYNTLESAKTRIFETIIDGSLDKYMKKKDLI